MAPRGSTGLVGRIRELEELGSAIEATAAGAGGTVLIAGEAGIGKTRLVSELAARADEKGFEVLLGRSIDLVGSDLPYQPFLEALRPLGGLPQADLKAGGSQSRMFEETLARLGAHAASEVLLVLEDVHWADASTLDLFLFLAYNVADRGILLVATYRPDEPSSSERMGRLAAAVRRSGSGLVLELGPLGADEVRALVTAYAREPPAAALTELIVARCEGSPFFAEELLKAGQDDDHPGKLPRALRDLLLARFAELDAATQRLLRLVAAAGSDVGYGLLRTLDARSEREVQESLREAVEHGVLVAVEATGRFRFRHALLAEAVYSTILPGERDELHATLAEELARTGAVSPAELASHWAAAGRRPEALAASVRAARQAEAGFGLAEAYAHLERVLALWADVPDASELAGLALPDLCAWTADLARLVGDAARALELGRRAIELIGGADPHRAAVLQVGIAEDLHAIGNRDAVIPTLEHAVRLAPADPPSPERAFALGSLAGGLMMARRYGESLAIAEQALDVARAVGARQAEIRALTVVGVDLANLGRDEEGLSYLRDALQLAEEVGDRLGLERAYVNFTDTLMKLGRPRESARLGEAGLELMRRWGIHASLLVSNQIEALLAIGEWDAADRLSAAALRTASTDFHGWLLVIRAAVEISRGALEAARAHIEAASATPHEDHVFGLYDSYVAELPLWEHRWDDADATIREGVAHARGREAAQMRVQLCAKGLRAQAELAALARARRDENGLRDRLGRARELLSVARQAAAEASAVFSDSGGWLALAEAEHARAGGAAQPGAWMEAAAAWERLERPPLAAYCRWREAEALVGSGASRTDSSAPLREARAVAARIGAKPLLREIDLLAERARLDLAAPEAVAPHEARLGETLGLTAREAEVLKLIARGYTNREIAAALVISVKTASVHVSHILQKLDAPNRREAAAIAHRLAPPHPHWT